MRLVRAVIVAAAAFMPTLLLAQPIPTGPEFQVNTYTTDTQGVPAVAMDGSGNFVVVWGSRGDQDGSETGIFGQRFDSTGGTVGGEFQVNTYTTDYQYLPAVAMDGSGNIVVVWQSWGDQDGNQWGIFGQRYDGTGAAVGGEFLVNTYTTSSQAGPAVAMDGTGDFVVVWSSSYQDGSDGGIFGQRFDSTGAAVGSEFQVNTYTTNKQSFPAVAMDDSGDFVVVWHSEYQDGSGYGVFGQRFDSTGAAAGSEFQVNTYTSHRQARPAVAMDGSGDFVVVWESESQDGDMLGVFGQRYDGAGAAVGGEFLVNTYTNSHQFVPAVAMDGSGDFVVVWQSDGLDGSARGIFGQRFTCTDTDGDGLCDFEDIIITSPLDGDTLDCSDPRTTRPTITWDPGNYERFRAFLSADPSFTDKRLRVTHWDTWLRSTSWTPGKKRWRRACRSALEVSAINPVLYIRVLGVDGDLRKKDPERRTYSQVVQVDAPP